MKLTSSLCALIGIIIPGFSYAEITKTERISDKARVLAVGEINLGASLKTVLGAKTCQLVNISVGPKRGSEKTSDTITMFCPLPGIVKGIALASAEFRNEILTNLTFTIPIDDVSLRQYQQALIDETKLTDNKPYVFGARPKHRTTYTLASFSQSQKLFKMTKQINELSFISIKEKLEDNYGSASLFSSKEDFRKAESERGCFPTLMWNGAPGWTSVVANFLHGVDGGKTVEIRYNSEP